MTHANAPVPGDSRADSGRGPAWHETELERGDRQSPVMPPKKALTSGTSCSAYDPGMTSQYPTPSSAAVSAAMRANPRRDTAPERRLRSALHRRGWRFRIDFPVHSTARRVRPDIVFTRRRVAVFVDGCFWHSCPEHGTQPRSNASYWVPKLRRSVERDLADTESLSRAGWTVVRVWEHEHLATAVAIVEKALGESARQSCG